MAEVASQSCQGDLRDSILLEIERCKDISNRDLPRLLRYCDERQSDVRNGYYDDPFQALLILQDAAVRLESLARMLREMRKRILDFTEADDDDDNLPPDDAGEEDN